MRFRLEETLVIPVGYIGEEHAKLTPGLQMIYQHLDCMWTIHTVLSHCHACVVW